MSKKKGDPFRLTAVDAEVIHQVYAVTQNKSETARRTGFSPQTVRNILQRAEDDAVPVQQARANAAVKMAGKIHVKAEEILDSISPDDIESGRIPVYDKEGRITGYKTYGPNLVQKATAFGILTDKANIVQQYEKALKDETHSGQLMLPQDIDGLRNAIGGKIKELTAINIRFSDDNADLVRRTETLVAEAQALEAVATDTSDVIEFDGFDQ